MTWNGSASVDWRKNMEPSAIVAILWITLVVLVAVVIGLSLG